MVVRTALWRSRQVQIFAFPALLPTETDKAARGGQVVIAHSNHNRLTEPFHRVILITDSPNTIHSYNC